jgi:hypothetical protein
MTHSATLSEDFESEPKAAEATGSNSESVDLLLNRWGEQIFHRGFGAIFGRWIGRDGCPFV